MIVLCEKNSGRIIHVVIDMREEVSEKRVLEQPTRHVTGPVGVA